MHLFRRNSRRVPRRDDSRTFVEGDTRRRAKSQDAYRLHYDHMQNSNILSRPAFNPGIDLSSYYAKPRRPHIQDPLPLYSRHEPGGSSTDQSSNGEPRPRSQIESPFPILDQLIRLVRELKIFVKAHRAQFKKEEDSTITYECENPLPDVDTAISFTINRIAPFHRKINDVFTDQSSSSYGFDASAAEVRNMDHAFRPFFNKMVELDQEMRAMIHPPPKPVPMTLRDRWRTRGQGRFFTYHALASQAETHVRRHLRELMRWLEADDFNLLPPKAQATLLTIPGGRFQKKFCAVASVTRYPYNPVLT